MFFVFFGLGLELGPGYSSIHYFGIIMTCRSMQFVVTGTYDTYFKWGDLKVQLGQFLTIVVSNNISIGKGIEIISDLEKSHNQKTFNAKLIFILFLLVCSSQPFLISHVCCYLFSYQLLLTLTVDLFHFKIDNQL